MKIIRLNTSPLPLIILGGLIFIIGIVGLVVSEGYRSYYLVLSGCSGAFSFTLFLIYERIQNSVSKLLITPAKITLTYTRGEKVDINTNDLEILDVKITKQLGKSVTQNAFPYHIEVSLKERSGYEHYFHLTKENYNIVFQLYNAFAGMIPHIHIKATGKHANIIQEDVDTYITRKKRIPLCSRFWKSLNKREKIEIFVFLFFILLIPGIILFFVFFH